MALIRVRDKETGHEYDLPETAFDPDIWAKVAKPSQWPDLAEGQLARPPLLYVGSRRPRVAPDLDSTDARVADTKDTAK